MSARTYLRGFPGLLRRIADRLDPAGAPRGTGFSFTFEPGEGIRFRQDRRGCPIWYLGEDDFERAHDEAGPVRPDPGAVRITVRAADSLGTRRRRGHAVTVDPTALHTAHRDEGSAPK